MATDGENNGSNTGAADDPVAAAEKALKAAEEAAAKAAAAAEEARKRAADLAQGKETPASEPEEATVIAPAATSEPPAPAPPAQVDEPPDLGVSSPAPAAPPAVAASAAPIAAPTSTSPVRIDAHEGGIFAADGVDETAARAYVPERSFMGGPRSKGWIAALGIGLVLIIGGILYLASSAEASERMKWFWAGTSCVEDPKSKGPHLPDVSIGEAAGNLNCLQLYVEKEARLAEARQKDLDFRSRHIYGTVNLTYFPQDARVDVYEAKFIKDGRAWARNEAGLGEPVCDAPYSKTPDDKILSPALKGKGRCERSIANASQKLKENEFLEELPLKTVPIFETDKCHDKSEYWNSQVGFCKVNGEDYRMGQLVKAYNFEYRVVITKEGYEPREFVWTKQSWTRAPGRYIMNWPGADLVPKPETLRSNFVAAQCQLFCYQVAQDVPFSKIPEGTKDLIFKRNGFKDEMDFGRTETALTRGEFRLWWEAQFAKIKELEGKKELCEKPESCDEIVAAAVPPEEGGEQPEPETP